MRTFPKGLHPCSCKEQAQNVRISEFPAPELVYIPLSQHSGAHAEPIVSAGERVKMGQRIGKAAGTISADIFSSVSGTVKSVENLNAAFGRCLHIIIENDNKDEEFTLPPLNNPDAEEIVGRVREAGIVGMGGAGFPTAVKLSPPKPVDTLLINGAECEPYITADYRIMLDLTHDFVEGCRLLMRALKLTAVTIGIEDNKPEAIAHLNSYFVENNISDVSVCELQVKYPQGAEKQLIYAVTGRRVPRGGLPPDIGVVVQNVHTALSTYYAVVRGQTLYKRVLTVTGGAVKNPANMWVRTGTRFAELIAHCGLKVYEREMTEFEAAEKAAREAFEADKSPENKLKYREAAERKREAAQDFTVKLIDGGPMMGTAVPDDTIPVTKTTSCILLLSAAEANLAHEYPCILCGKCSKVCPMNLMPMFIDAAMLSKDYAESKKYGASDCILCGCCAYICPSKRPLVQNIQLARKIIKEKRL